MLVKTLRCCSVHSKNNSGKNIAYAFQIDGSRQGFNSLSADNGYITFIASQIVEYGMKSRIRFWHDWPIASDAADSVYNSDFSKALTIADAELSQINNLVYEMIYHSLDHDIQREVVSASHHEDIAGYLDTQDSFSVNFKKNADRFVQLEKILIATMSRRGLLKHITGIQFPIDIRVVQATPPPGYLDRKDAIDYMHCDGWRGEPDDGVNCLLYCRVNKYTSRLHIVDLPEDSIDLIASSNEKNCLSIIKHLKPIEFNHNPGVLIFFDSFSPHHTMRMGNKARISLNFSLRRSDVYSVLDERWGRKRQSWDKYWYLPTNEVESFESRCTDEMSRLRKESKTKAASLRQRYIDEKLLHNSNEVY